MEQKLVVKLDKDPYDLGYNLYSKKSVSFTSGRMTVLVGCNGSGKSTLLQYIKNMCDNKEYSFISYNNLSEGGQNSVSERAFFHDFDTVANLIMSSEGESISINITQLASKIGSKIGEDPARPIVITLDAVDSGLSIDNIVELKEFIGFILEQNSGVPVYIIASANEYELARDEYCLDVQTLKEITFSNYDEYRDFIIASRKKKDEKLIQVKD